MVRSYSGRQQPKVIRSYSHRQQPNRTGSWYSEKSDGYYDDGKRHYPCYHDCRNCPHLQTIMKNGNQQQGRGWDHYRKRERRICRACRTLKRRKRC